MFEIVSGEVFANVAKGSDLEAIDILMNIRLRVTWDGILGQYADRKRKRRGV